MWKWHGSIDFVPEKMSKLTSRTEGWYLRVAASGALQYLQSFNLSRACDEEKMKQDVFVKHKCPDNGQFQIWPRSQGQIF